MEKKYVLWTVFVFIFIFILLTKDRIVVANDTDLNKMMDIIGKTEGRITEWQLLARQSIVMTEKQRSEQREKWERQFPDFTWKERKEKGEWVLEGEYSSPGDLYKESIQIVATRLYSAYQGYILYKIQGEKWTGTVRMITEKKINHLLPQFFRKRPSLYACVTGVVDDMMNISAMEKALEINDLLQGEIVEKLEENAFVSFTSKSPYFANELTVNEKPFNVQISVRKNDRDAVFAIGTPILTIEY